MSKFMRLRAHFLPRRNPSTESLGSGVQLGHLKVPTYLQGEETAGVLGGLNRVGQGRRTSECLSFLLDGTVQTQDVVKMRR